jgi:flavin-dependent dehydrogenase
MSSEALIVGGGPAGASLAIRLANAGREVVLLEKKSIPHHKVCGEFLSREAIHYLSQIGIDLIALGAQPISRLRLIFRNRTIESNLPFPALSLSRQHLDESLLSHAAKAGVEVIRGYGVESLQRNDSVWQAQLNSGEYIRGRDAFLASGKHDLRGWQRPEGNQNDLIAFKMYWRLTETSFAEIKQHVELVLFPGGYCGLQPVEDGVMNLCLLVRRETFRKFGGTFTHLMEAIQADSLHLTKRFDQAVALWPRPLSISSIPYGHIHAHQDGLWRLGDQMAVIGSFSGDGMSIALHSAALAASTYLSGGTSDKFHRIMRLDTANQVSLATKISRAFVSSPKQHWITRGIQLWPGVLRVAARATRIPDRALLTLLEKDQHSKTI